MKLHSLEYLLRGCVGEYQPMQVCVTGWDVGNPFEWRVREEVENSGQDLLFVKRWVSRWVMPKGDWTQERVWNVYRELDGARRQVQWLLSGGCGDGVWREVYVDTFCSMVMYMDALHDGCSAEVWYSEVEKLLLLWLLDFCVLDYRLLCKLRKCDGRCRLAWEMLKKWRSFVWGDRDESIPAQLYVWQSDIFGFEFLVEIDDIVSSELECNRRLYSNRCASRDSLTDAESRNFRRCDFLWHCLFYLLRDGVRCGDKSIYYRQLVFHIIMCEEAILDYMGVLDVIAQYGATEEKENKLESILFLDSHQKGVVLGAFELYTRCVYDCVTLWDDEMEDVFADDEPYGFVHVFPTIKSKFPTLWQKIEEQVGGEEEQVADKNDETEHLIKEHLAWLDGEYKGARFIPHNDYERLVGYVRELIATGKCPKDVEPIERLTRKERNGERQWGIEWVSRPIADIHDELFEERNINTEWADLVGKLCYEGDFDKGISKFREKPQNCKKYEETKKNVKF